MANGSKYEKLSVDDNFVRRIDHETDFIESICLHCYATIGGSRDTKVNLQIEYAHHCPQREAAENRRAHSA